MLPLTAGVNALTTSRMADGKTLTPRTISMSSVRPMQRTRGPVRPHVHSRRANDDVVARAEPQERRRAVAEVRQDELARRAVLERDGRARRGVDQLGVDEPARAEVHPVLLLALAPQRDADVADPHRLRHPRAPALLERARGRPARRRRARPRRARARRSTPAGRGPVRQRPRRGSAAYDGVSTTASGRSSSIARSSRSVLPVPTGMWHRPIRSNDASAAPAANGPAL